MQTLHASHIVFCWLCSEVLFILALKLIQSKIISQLFQEFLANTDIFFFPSNADFLFSNALQSSASVSFSTLEVDNRQRN